MIVVSPVTYVITHLDKLYIIFAAKEQEKKYKKG
jgi:hypothetical protein